MGRLEAFVRLLVDGSIQIFIFRLVDLFTEINMMSPLFFLSEGR